MVPDMPDSVVDLARRVAELETENRRLRQLLGFDGRPSVAPTWEPTLFTGQAEAAERKVNRRSPPEDKVALFRALFRGRDDVYALRWENARTGRNGWSPAVKGGWVNARKLLLSGRSVPVRRLKDNVRDALRNTSYALLGFALSVVGFLIIAPRGLRAVTLPLAIAEFVLAAIFWRYADVRAAGLEGLAPFDAVSDVLGARRLSSWWTWAGLLASVLGSWPTAGIRTAR